MDETFWVGSQISLSRSLATCHIASQRLAKWRLAAQKKHAWNKTSISTFLIQKYAVQRDIKVKFREQLLYRPLRLRVAKTKVVWRRRWRLHQQKDIFSAADAIKHLLQVCSDFSLFVRNVLDLSAIIVLVESTTWSAACVGRAFLVSSFYDYVDVVNFHIFEKFHF